jgi:hypothetical protein
MPEDMVKVTIRLPAALVKRAKIHAVQTDQDLQDLVRTCLEACLRDARSKGGR